MKQTLQEKEIIAHFNRKVRQGGGFSHKISDFSPDYKPFDCFGAVNGHLFFLEFKRVAAGENLAYSAFEPQQLRVLQLLSENHDLASTLIGAAIGIYQKRELLGIYFLPYAALMTAQEKKRGSWLMSDIMAAKPLLSLLGL